MGASPCPLERGLFRAGASLSGSWEKELVSALQSGSQLPTCRLASKAPFVAFQQSRTSSFWLGPSRNLHTSVLEGVRQAHRARGIDLVDS